jgi:hypothetical protein
MNRRRHRPSPDRPRRGGIGDAVRRTGGDDVKLQLKHAVLIGDSTLRLFVSDAAKTHRVIELTHKGQTLTPFRSTNGDPFTIALADALASASANSEVKTP